MYRFVPLAPHPCITAALLVLTEIVSVETMQCWPGVITRAACEMNSHAMSLTA